VCHKLFSNYSIELEEYGDAGLVTPDSWRPVMPICIFRHVDKGMMCNMFASGILSLLFSERFIIVTWLTHN
jgi:hypothetical protein